jgi:hypothetical protein
MHEHVENSEAHVDTVSCAVCIIGAGIAGLNALFVATRYLSATDKVVLVDRNPRAGGMWQDTYDYVRLHQPYSMFTAGNMPWELDQAPAYLAARDEVLDHLHHCLAVLRQKLTLEEYYGYSLVSLEESASDDAVYVHCSAPQSVGRQLRIRAQKCIKAFGMQVTPNEPLEFSSIRVRSISPDDFDVLGAEMRASQAPIYIVGGGKTAMDTAGALLRHFSDKRVSLLIGAGTIFMNRDKLLPRGARRYWASSTVLEGMLDIARRYDGDNEAQVLAYLRSTYGLSLNDECRRFMYGILSSSENNAVREGAAEILSEYLHDVVDAGDDSVMCLRSGGRRRVERGSWFINCTGYILRKPQPYEPYVSAGGRVISIQGTSAIAFLSTYGAYLLSHLLFLGKASKLPLYELDYIELASKCRDAMALASTTHSLYNMALILESVPTSVLKEFGSNLDEWFPKPRRLIGLARFMWFQKLHPDHFRDVLDRVHERYGVRCGLLRPEGGAETQPVAIPEREQSTRCRAEQR